MQRLKKYFYYFLQQPITYENWRSCHDPQEKIDEAQATCFNSSPVELQTLLEILRGQISKSLKFNNDKISLTEYMFDTTLSYTIPLDYLQ